MTGGPRVHQGPGWHQAGPPSANSCWPEPGPGGGTTALPSSTSVFSCQEKKDTESISRWPQLGLARVLLHPARVMFVRFIHGHGQAASSPDWDLPEGTSLAAEFPLSCAQPCNGTAGSQGALSPFPRGSHLTPFKAQPRAPPCGGEGGWGGLQAAPWQSWVKVGQALAGYGSLQQALSSHGDRGQWAL